MRIRCVRAARNKLALLSILLLLVSGAASAQSFLGMQKPLVQVFGGYSLARYDTVPLGFSERLNLSGVNIQVIFADFYRGLGLAFDFSGHSSNEMQYFNFLVGPQYRYQVKGIFLFGHGLFGRSRTHLNNLGTSQFSPSTIGGTAAFGGGLDIPWKHGISFRPIQADYMITSAYGDRRHNIRYSTGVTFTFGKSTKEPSF